MLGPTSCDNNIVNRPNENMTIKKRLGVQIKKKKALLIKISKRLCIVDNEFNNSAIKYNSGNVVEPQNTDTAAAKECNDLTAV